MKSVATAAVGGVGGGGLDNDGGSFGDGGLPTLLYPTPSPLPPRIIPIGSQRGDYTGVSRRNSAT